MNGIKRWLKENAIKGVWPERFQELQKQEKMNPNSNYQGKHSLYHYATALSLNVYEFDIIKRLLRKKAGNEQLDIEKTIVLLDMYMSDFPYQDKREANERWHGMLDKMLDDYQANSVLREVIINSLSGGTILFCTKSVTKAKELLQENQENIISWKKAI